MRRRAEGQEGDQSAEPSHELLEHHDATDNMFASRTTTQEPFDCF